MESSTVAWRPTDHPRIVPLNQTVKFHAKELEHLLDKEFEIVADSRRKGFVSIISDDGWFYVHVRGTTIYLVHHLPLANGVRLEAMNRNTKQSMATS